MMKKIKLKIEGMHCGACATGIELLFSNKEGVLNIKVDYDKKIGELEYDEAKIKLEEMIKEIKELGYTASVIG